MNGSGNNVRGNLGVNAITRHNVNAPDTENFLQKLLDCGQVEQRDGPVEIDEYIHVARGSGLIAGNRTEKCNVAHAEPIAQHVPVLP
jgi:hypothetical protein